MYVCIYISNDVLKRAPININIPLFVYISISLHFSVFMLVCNHIFIFLYLCAIMLLSLHVNNLFYKYSLIYLFVSVNIRIFAHVKNQKCKKVNI